MVCSTKKLPKNIFDFTIRYANNTLPTREGTYQPGTYQPESCAFCLSPESLLHVVAENFDEMLRSLKLDAQYSKYIKKKIVNMCIRTSYYIFYRRNKEWNNPKLYTIMTIYNHFKIIVEIIYVL